MDTTTMRSMLEKTAISFDHYTESPEATSKVNLETCEKFKIITKQLYACVFGLNELTKLKTKALPKLLTDGFDEEQVWQQLELQNKCAMLHFAKCIPKLNSENISLGINERNEDLSENNLPIDAHTDALSSSGDEEYPFDDDSDSSTELQKQLRKPTPKSGVNYASKVDDQFFKLSKLEQFLKLEDLKEEKKDLGTSDYEDEIDLYQDIPSDDVDDEEDLSDEDNARKTKKSSKDLMYEDFFDAPESVDETAAVEFEGNKSDEEEELDDRNNQFEENEELDEYSNVSDDQESEVFQENITDNASVEKTQKTAFELEQDKIRKQIQECEKNMLEPLPWHLTGEVAASSRPVDSLVHKETEFDCNAKQDLIVDNDLNEKIENIIKTAMINKTFNDVERKVKPKEELIAYQKEIVVDQAKSKKGLAEVYEEDYLKKKTKQEKEEDPKHKEIKKLMDELLPELHALFTHIPKPAVPEIKIVSNLPAITVEEVAPTNISDVALLAPEEVKKKTGLIKGQNERTDTDRKRERRKKKLLQKLKEKKRKEKLEKLDGQDKPKSARARKLEKIETLKKLKQHRNTTIANMDESHKIKSSKDFFSRLQDTIHAKSVKISSQQFSTKSTKRKK